MWVKLIVIDTNANSKVKIALRKEREREREREHSKLDYTKGTIKKNLTSDKMQATIKNWSLITKINAVKTIISTNKEKDDNETHVNPHEMPMKI